MKWLNLLTIGLAAVLVTVLAESEPNAFAPELNMKDTDNKKVDVYRGFIVTNEDTVSMVPPLSASDKDKIGGARFICGYRIYGGDYDIPFEAHVETHTDGQAKLKVKAGVKLAELSRRKYKFEISAFDCGSPTLHSERAHVVVQVLSPPQEVTPPLPDDLKKLINKEIKVVDHKSPAPPSPPKDLEHPPIPTGETSSAVYPKLPLPDNGGEQYFERSSYIVVMREETLYDSIIKLKPLDGKLAVNICGYEVVTADVPFAVDEMGNVHNTKALDASVQKSYIVSVVAKHCNGLVSKPALLNIQVSEICANGWKELPTDQEYKAGSKAINPFSEAWFDTCTTSCTDSESASVTISLESDGDMNMCSHDAFSIQSQRDTCGVASSTVELLPKGKKWTEPLTAVDGHEAAYKFDGKTAVKVPSEQSNHILGDFFTIATWMQHGQEKKDGHKEHVLCNADGDGMNRHHYAMFVHNCRLVFLLRKEASQVDSLDKFQPAEWRWTIPQVCDNNWHHYALSVTYPTATLYVDGQEIQADKSVVEVVDDWALHPTDKVTFEQLTVGGCWQGETKTFGQFFDGSLAGLTMLNGTTETERAVKCMNKCGEKLQFHAMDQLTVGMSVSFNTELTELTIRGNDMDEVKAILQQVGYTNTYNNPKAGYRRLTVKTNVTCDGKPLEVKDQVVPVLVSEVADPKITIAGARMKARTASEFTSGVDLFTELMILSAPDKELNGQENRINKIDLEDVNQMQVDLKKRLMLEKCQVRVDVKMVKNEELLRLPADLLVKYLMETKEFDEGFDITGAASFAHYEEVLRETYYINRDVGKDFPGRKFTIQCFGRTGKYSSNLFTVELDVMEEEIQSKVLYADPKYAHLQVQSLSASANSVVGSAHASAATGTSSGTVAAVVVVCIALLIGVIVIAVVRIRRVQANKKSGNNMNVEDGPEMEWDNSTLHVTVNPFESDALMQEMKSDSTVVCDSDEEEMMSSEDEDDGAKDGGLEWDNSSY